MGGSRRPSRVFTFQTAATASQKSLLSDKRVLIALNMGSEPVAVSFPDASWSGRVLLSSFADREEEEVGASIDLRGNEGLLVLVAPKAVGS